MCKNPLMPFAASMRFLHMRELSVWPKGCHCRAILPLITLFMWTVRPKASI